VTLCSTILLRFGEREAGGVDAVAPVERGAVGEDVSEVVVAAQYPSSQTQPWNPPTLKLSAVLRPHPNVRAFVLREKSHHECTHYPSLGDRENPRMPQPRVIVGESRFTVSAVYLTDNRVAV